MVDRGHLRRLALIACAAGVASACTPAPVVRADRVRDPYLLPVANVEPYEVVALIVGVTDGDTLTGLSGEQQLKIRLGQIDAPERRQPFGRASKRSLSNLCYTVEARVRVYDQDRYGRVVAMVECDGRDASREQVARGMAWAYPKYVIDETLFDVEREAREKGLGLWSEPGPVPPWEWRRGSRKR